MLTLTYQTSGTADSATVPLCGPLCHNTTTLATTNDHQVADFFGKLLNTDDFPARWHCGNWTDFHGWLYIISDITIWAAYFAIPILLLRVMIKRKGIVLSNLIILFLAFVFLCGLTHLMDALIFWWPAYRLSALLRLATAIVSVIAAFALSRVFPMLLGLRSVRELKLEIARRQRTEERLTESEFLLSEAGRIARVGGWEYDLLTQKRKYSKAVYQILEIPQGHDINQEHPMSYYPEPYRSMLEKGIIGAIKNGVKWDVETLAVTLNNKTLWVRHIGEPIFDSKGQTIKVRGTLTDIDQYKKHELELSNALKVATEKTDRLKKFGYILSHNVRNHTSNLAALMAMAEIETIDDDNKEIMLKSRQVTRALTSTLDDLAEIMEAQEELLADETVSFKSSLTKAMAAYSVQIGQTHAQINSELLISEVKFPSLFLDSIMKHLLSNAIRYRNPDETLQVEFKSYLNSTGDVVLECRDNGIGIDLTVHGQKLFNLYATFHPSLSGRGVGLFLIKTQVESQGGEFLVDSAPGEGSVFQVIFKKSA
jgi:signal transduction histidine kinase